MSRRAFEKYEGLGNDFVIVRANDEYELGSERAAKICDRRRGVGGDGVLLVLPPRDAKHAARMKVLNADGSIPEMCGNGLRCVALHVAERSWGDAKREPLTLDFETDAGDRTCTIEADPSEKNRAFVNVDMGIVKDLGACEIDVEGARVELLLANAGNPHAIRFGSALLSIAERFGKAIATHAVFPEGTNASFANVTDGAIDLVVWERGVGITLACGTAACATTAIAAMRGMVPYDRAIDVRLPGGTLAVTCERVTGRVWMRGPARRVFSGTIDDE
jgi:diaminopimelate epimerase